MRQPVISEGRSVLRSESYDLLSRPPYSAEQGGLDRRAHDSNRRADGPSEITG